VGIYTDIVYITINLIIIKKIFTIKQIKGVVKNKNVHYNIITESFDVNIIITQQNMLYYQYKIYYNIRYFKQKFVRV